MCALVAATFHAIEGDTFFSADRINVMHENISCASAMLRIETFLQQYFNTYK